MTRLILTPLASLAVRAYRIQSNPPWPNTSLRPDRPLLIYAGAFRNVTADAIESHLSSVGVVVPQWRYSMYRRHHYHSTTHEVLVIVCGSAHLCFGGPSNPEKTILEAKIGDVIIVPAGVSHALLDENGGFQMVGAYPPDSEPWDMCVNEATHAQQQNIRSLGWFERDPIYGNTDDGKSPINDHSIQ